MILDDFWWIFHGFVGRSHIIRCCESDFEKNNDLFVNLKKSIFQILPRSTRTKSLGVIMEHLQKLAKKKSGSGAWFFLDFPGAGPLKRP
jgi:hypothetical protein